MYAKYFSAKHLLHGRSATITQQSLIGYGFAATHVSLNLLIVRNKDFNGLHPDTIGKFSSLGLKFPRNKTDCLHCNRLYLLQGKKEKAKKSPEILNLKVLHMINNTPQVKMSNKRLEALFDSLLEWSAHTCPTIFHH